MNIPSKFISTLDLSNSNLQNFPVEIFELKNLKKLNLSNNEISKIPSDIVKLKRLEHLDLSNNKISNIYAKVCELKKLKTLNFNNNRIKTIPLQIGKLTELRVLLLSNNKISNIDSLVNFLHLRKLNISSNPIITLPNSIFDLKNLKSLWISNLPLKEFPLKKILENSKIRTLYCYSNLENGNISENGLYDFLAEIKGNCLPTLISIYGPNSLFGNTIDDLAIPSQKTYDRASKKYKRNIFICYSHVDVEWMKKVKTNLKVLNFEGYDFEVWDDNRISAGKNWKKEIDEALSKAGIAILLITMDFLASEFIQNNELPTLLKNAETKGTIIISVIVGHSRFLDSNLSEFLALNEPRSPLNSLKKSDQDKILVKLTYEVEQHLPKK